MYEENSIIHHIKLFAKWFFIVYPLLLIGVWLYIQYLNYYI